MSTRSGKRIHLSFHENTVKSEVEITKSERKTRSKHTKENLDETNVSPKVKKRNYVAYPADDDGIDTVDGKEARATRALRKNALKERNVASVAESVEPAEESRKFVRATRRTRKFDDNTPDAPAEHPQDAVPTETELPKPKKGKKKKKKQEIVEKETKVPKKKSKKKKDRRSGSIVVEDVQIEAPSLNKSNISVDSFHSAAGSPGNVKNNCKIDPTDKDTTAKHDLNTQTRKTRSSLKLDIQELVTEKEPRRRKSSVAKIDDIPIDDSEKVIDNRDTSKELRKRKSSIKVDVSDDKDNQNSTFDVEKVTRKSLRNTFDKTPSKSNIVTEGSSSRKSKRKSINDVTVIEDKHINIVNTTFDKDTEIIDKVGSSQKKRKSTINITDESTNITRKSIDDIVDLNPKIKNDTFEITENSNVNTTFEKSYSKHKKLIVNMTFDLTSSPFKSANEMSSPVNGILSGTTIINTTYEKDTDAEPNKKSINTTYDKETTENKIDTTLEKDLNDKVKNKRKSLLRLSTHKISDLDISKTLNDQEKKLDATFDKISKSSLISSDNSLITLDKSDASRVSITSDESKTEENILNTTPVLIESSMDESVNTTKTPIKESSPEAKAPITPLKREGTFTKEPDVTVQNLSKTPTKQLSLPSPGCTPFPKSSSKEKSVLNVTRSVEKRRSSLVEPPRTTRVIFCSPVNNPAVVTQNRRKVIKSNLKGSNKSFVYDESVSLQSRPGSRKRSYTQSDAQEAAALRPRPASPAPGGRFSRARTSSASAKLAVPTTPTKQTPKKPEAKVPRTKLPNFAALHQKQFSRMESLDECQQRRAKRARQLLTPTGAKHMLERISPKDKTVEQEKPKEAPVKPKEDTKPETPIKSLPSFKSLNPGFTRFGFKLNLDVNPFSIPSKTQPKPKENKPNGLTRQPILPSLTGTTSIRREVAKQTVMREKSFTDKRSVKRTENTRTVIKGVRTNRRFELQMRMRDI